MNYTSEKEKESPINPNIYSKVDDINVPYTQIRIERPHSTPIVSDTSLRNSSFHQKRIFFEKKCRGKTNAHNYSDDNEMHQAARWQQEATRLSHRVKELDDEVKRLKGVLDDESKVKNVSHTRYVTDYDGKTRIAAAAAASHKHRALRSISAAKVVKSSFPLQESHGSIRNSFSCNNLDTLRESSMSNSFFVPIEIEASGTNDANHRQEKLGSTIRKSNSRKDHNLNDTNYCSIASTDERLHPLKSTKRSFCKAKSEKVLYSKNNHPVRNSHDLAFETPPTTDDEKNSVETRSISLAEGGIGIWVGTWNIGARDPFVDAKGILDERVSSWMISPFVPHGYEIYCIGIQEGITENVYHAMEAYLNRNPNATRYYRLQLRNNKCLVPNNGFPADFLFDCVRGRGDGAFVGRKFTGMAIFIAEPMKDQVILLRATIHKFSIASGSKGGVAVALRVCKTTIAFVNCHLDARNDIYRREQIQQLTTQLGHSLGYHCFDLCDQFHHIIWMGDLNYRIHTLDAETVLHMLADDRNKELHDQFDSLLVDRLRGAFYNFTEPKKWPTFYPTYKKIEGHLESDLKDPSWPYKLYRVQYKEPFYRGGQVKFRIPGWCDRILLHSIRDSISQLVPEKVPHPSLRGLLIDNYRSINDGHGMNVSDHSPVFATFILTFPDSFDLEQNLSTPPSSLASPDLLRTPSDVSRSSQEPTRLSFLSRLYPPSRNSSGYIPLSESAHSESATETKPSSILKNFGSQTYPEFRPSHISSTSSGNVSTFLHPSSDLFIQSKRKASLLALKPISTIIRVFKIYLHVCGRRVSPKKIRLVAPLFGEDDGKQCDSIGERASDRALPGERIGRATLMRSIQAHVLIQHYKPIEDLNILLWARQDSIEGQCTASLKQFSTTKSDLRSFHATLTHHGEVVKFSDSIVTLSFSVRIQAL